MTLLSRWRTPLRRVAPYRPLTRVVLGRWAVVCLFVGFLAEWAGVFEFAELKTYDSRVLRFGKSIPAAPELVSIVIDAKSEQRISPFPWPHEVYAALATQLEMAGCRRVYFALYFDREEEPSQAWDLVSLPVYLVRPYMEPYVHQPRKPPIITSWHALPSDFVRANIVASFSAYPASVRDGVYRFSQAVVMDEATNQNVYSLDWHFAARIRGNTPAELPLPHDSEGLLLAPRPVALPKVSFVDVLEGDPRALSLLRGKAAMVGAESNVRIPTLMTPFGTQTALDVRAATVNGILTDSLVRPRNLWVSACLFVGWGLATIPAGWWVGRRLSRVSHVFAVGIAAMLLHTGIALFAFRLFSVWLPIITPVGSLFMMTFAWTLSVNAAHLRTAQQRSLQAEREAAFGVMSAQVRHEIRNHLNSIRSPAEMIRKNFQRDDPLGMKDRPEELVTEMDVIIERVGQLSDMVEKELSFLQPGSYRFAPQDIWDVVREVRTLQAAELQAANIVVREEAPNERPVVSADVERLRLVFVNLIRNAIQAMPNGGTLSLQFMERRVRFGGRRVMIRVSDTGIGMSAEHLSRIFEPFFTTKAKGLGLGLLNAKNVVEAHGGEISVQSVPGEGTVFDVIFPIGSQQP